MSRVWINSSKLAGVTDGSAYLHYIEEPAIENEPLGSVAQHSGETKVRWFVKGKMGNASSIEDGKQCVEARLQR